LSKFLTIRPFNYPIYTLIELASQVIGAGQADWLANFDV
jgi:hypothetical protein